MATTINNTTVNSRLTIVFDAAGSLDGNGPALGTGNTESDVYIDNNVYYNLRSHTEIDANVHALQWNATTNTGEIEYTDNRDNLSITTIPQWVTNVVIRCEAQDVWQSTFESSRATRHQALLENPEINKDSPDYDATVLPLVTQDADTARNDYLTAHSITF